MRWVVLALVVGCSSKENPEDKREPPKQPRFAIDALVPTYSDDPPWDAADVDAEAIETGTVTIKIPSVRGTQKREGAMVIARVGNGWRKVEAFALIVTADGVQVPPGEPIELADVARAATPAGVLVIEQDKRFVDADLGFALVNECWSFATVDAGVVGGLWPEPCPANTPEGKDVPQVAVALTRDGHMLGLTSTREITRTREIEDIVAKLRATKATQAFAKRADVLYTTFGVTVEELVPKLAQIHQTGFTGTRWVPPVWIPMRLDSDIGFEPPPPAPVGPQRVPLGPPRPPPPVVRVSVGDVSVDKGAGLTADEVARIVATRVGIYRACYQKELNRKPGLAGRLHETVDVAATGEVTASSVKSTLKDEAVETCVAANLKRLRFPPKPTATRFKVSLTFIAS